MLHALDRVERSRPRREGDAGQARRCCAPLQKLSETLRRRSLVVLISDFYEDPDAILDALAHVRGRGNDLIVFHLLDPHEIDFRSPTRRTSSTWRRATRCP